MCEIEETWASRDLPILKAALRRLDAGEDYADLEEIRRELGFTGDRLLAGIRALESADPPYIEADRMMGWREDHAAGTIDVVSERARRELGGVAVRGVARRRTRRRVRPCRGGRERA
jgi:hypothetical protein